MKVPISDQIAEAERHRDEVMRLFLGEGRLTPALKLREQLDRAEAIVLTLHFVQANEQGFRAYYRQKQESEA